MRQLIIPFLVYVIATFAIAFVWHLKLFEARYKALAVYREKILPQFGLSAMAIQGICFAVIYNGLIAPMTGGFLAKAAAYAALGGVLSWSFTTLTAAAKNPMSSISGFMAIETAFTIVQWIVVAAITAALA